MSTSDQGLHFVPKEHILISISQGLLDQFLNGIQEGEVQSMQKRGNQGKKNHLIQRSLNDTKSLLHAVLGYK